MSTDRKEAHVKMQLQPSTNEVLMADSADSAEYNGILASRCLALTAFVRHISTSVQQMSMMQASRVSSSSMHNTLAAQPLAVVTRRG